jgi:two-component system cell cycle sensor histidine kinase/response regulator CckA
MKNRGVTIRSQLVLLVLGTVIPVLVFAGISLLVFNKHSRDATGRGLAEKARALSVAIDQHVTASTSVLEALAASDHLRTGNLKEFDRTARAVLASQPRWQSIILFAADGRQLTNTRSPFGAPLPKTADPALVARVVRTRAATVSDLFTGSLSQRRQILAAVPVIHDGPAVYVLGATLAPTSFTDVLLQQRVPSSAIGTLLDRNKVIIARTRDADQFVGQLGTSDLAARMDQTAEGAFQLMTTDGQGVYSAISRSPRTGWTVALGVPQAAAHARLRSSLWLLTIVGVTTTLFGILAAVHWARRIANPITSLSAAAAALARGERVDPHRSPFAEVNAVRQAMERAGHERQQREATVRSLAAVGRELSATLDFAQVTNRIVSTVLEPFDASWAALYQIDSAGAVAVCLATAGDAESSTWAGQRFAKGDGVSGLVLAECRLISSSDVVSDPRITLPAWARTKIQEQRCRAMTGVPLSVRQQLLGVLVLGREAGRGFTDEELHLLSAFADQAALAWENARLFQGSERRRGAAEGLYQVGRLVSQSLDPREVSQRIVDSIRTLLSASTSVLFRLDPETADLVALTGSGEPCAMARQMLVLPSGAGAAGLAVREERAVVSADCLADPRILVTPDLRSRAEYDGFRAILAVPLLVQGRVLGALGVRDSLGRVFDAEDVRIAQAFADQAAIAIENARLYGETQERLVQSETLLAVSQQVAETLDVSEMMRCVAKEAGRALGADAVGAFLTDASRGYLRPIAGYHIPKDLLADLMASPIRLKGHHVLEEALERQRAVALSDVAADPGVDHELLQRFPHRSSLFCPMVVHGEPIGGLLLAWFEQEHRFTPAELRLVEGISRQAGIGLTNARLVEQLKQRQARLEALLGLGRELSRIQPVESLLTRIAEACGRLFDASTVAFRLVEGDDLVICGTWGPTDEALSSKPLNIHGSLSGTVARSGEILTVQDPVGDPRLDPAQRETFRRLGIRAFLGVPVKIKDQVVGVLTVRSARDEGFSPADVEMAEAFASQAGIALENSHLYQKIQKAFDELSDAQTQLVQAQKMQAIGQLAGGIAHDFNNLLTVIGGRSHLLLKRLPAGEPARRDVELIQKATDRATAMTHQLLAFSRKQVLEPRSLDLNALLGDLAPVLTRLIGAEIELVIVPGTGLGRLMADPGQLEQVIMNLLVNARDAMANGGTLKIETDNQDLLAAVAHALGQIPPGRYVTLTVRDSGCGVDSTTLARFFEPFFTTKGPGKGTGMGLSTVYGIVHQSGGYIGVDSAVGCGTTVTIYLPRTTAPADTAMAQGSSAPLASGRETILLVEDEEDVRQLSVEILTACGYRVLDTGDPMQALAIGAAHPGTIHLLLTDIVMPGMRGPALAAQTLARYPEMRVLYMSGYSDKMFGAQAAVAPAGTLLQKPFTPEALARAVRSALDAIPRVGGSNGRTRVPTIPR